ncbi:Hypothetical protein FSTVST1_282 [Faustovirus ST1]|nr:Hypothetical protein FSTVST1_282 [Faustovirus ST1]
MSILNCETEAAEFDTEYTNIVKELEKYDEVIDFGETPSPADQFKTIVKHMQDNDFDYVAVNCSYTTRLSGAQIDKFAISIGCKLVGMGAYIHPRAILSTPGEPKAEYGEVLFKCNKVTNVFKLTNHLIDYQHCGMFDWSTLYEVKTRTKGDINIVVLNFDTESG